MEVDERQPFFHSELKSAVVTMVGVSPPIPILKQAVGPESVVIGTTRFNWKRAPAPFPELTRSGWTRLFP